MPVLGCVYMRCGGFCSGFRGVMEPRGCGGGDVCYITAFGADIY